VRQRNGRRKVTLYNRHGEKLTVTVAQLMRQVGFLANIEPAPANFCGPEVTVTEPLPHVTAGGMVTARHGHRAFTQLKGMFCGGLPISTGWFNPRPLQPNHFDDNLSKSSKLPAKPSKRRSGPVSSKE
jgi:hypothetical protein